MQIIALGHCGRNEAKIDHFAGEKQTETGLLVLSMVKASACDTVCVASGSRRPVAGVT